MAQQMMEVDLENRDPNDINGHVRANFEDILAEPESAHSIPCIWTNSYKCFTCARNCVYKLVTLLCGICYAICWGCEFAIIALQHIWCITPCYRSCSIGCGAMQKFWTLVVSCIMIPLCESCGMFFSKIVVKNQ